MQKPTLSLVARNDMVLPSQPHTPEDEEMLAEEIEVERRGLPDFEIFEAASREELEAEIEEWRQSEVIGNPFIDGVVVMSPTVSADGMWRITVNFLVFANGVGPLS